MQQNCVIIKQCDPICQNWYTTPLQQIKIGFLIFNFFNHFIDLEEDGNLKPRWDWRLSYLQRTHNTFVGETKKNPQLNRLGCWYIQRVTRWWWWSESKVVVSRKQTLIQLPCPRAMAEEEEPFRKWTVNWRGITGELCFSDTWYLALNIWRTHVNFIYGGHMWRGYPFDINLGRFISSEITILPPHNT